MPIRPENLARYPADWKAISDGIRFGRAQGVCECAGECGKHPGRCLARHGEEHPDTGSVVVLTAGHRNHQPEDVRPENLAAWCQRCHLAYDAALHAATAARTRWARRTEGMAPLF
ncbi:hypothetical protein ACQP10_37975 (plasmid) [Streptosporangium sandarakinum]|uniref:hypothetical protein n=1 Tax=Streptosporangium sandarakinum TaxID=1260955 RepID=UPI003D89B3F9